MRKDEGGSMKDEKDSVSPTEKLRDDPSPAEQEEGIPGAQNPDSEEIKDEKKPNTE